MRRVPDRFVGLLNQSLAQRDVGKRVLRTAVFIVVQDIIAWLDENVAVRISRLAKIGGEIAVVPDVEEADALQCGNHRKIVAGIQAVRHRLLLQCIENATRFELEPTGRLPFNDFFRSRTMVEPTRRRRMNKHPIRPSRTRHGSVPVIANGKLLGQGNQDWKVLGCKALHNFTRISSPATRHV